MNLSNKIKTTNNTWYALRVNHETKLTLLIIRVNTNLRNRNTTNHTVFDSSVNTLRTNHSFKSNITPSERAVFLTSDITL